jgi:ABC-type branched-subunit amino acid transport system substrate-binding protein
VVFIALMLTPLLGLSQPREDRKAEKSFQDGMSAYTRLEYATALNFFTEVGARPFNRVTTPALYMMGLCSYRMGDYVQALSKFQHVISSYPSSIYVPDCQYHKGLIMLKSPESQEGGLFLLLNLAEQASNPQLRTDAENAAQKFFFEGASLEFLRNYLTKVRTRYKLAVLEALCYRLHQQGRRPEVLRRMREWTEAGNELSPNLRKLRDRPSTTNPRKEELRIAVMLPFYTDSVAYGISPRAKPALAYIAGMQMAFRDSLYPGLNAIEFQVYDTRGDTARTRQLLGGEVAQFEPDVIIGDYTNGSSALIAKHCAQHNLLHIVPISPISSLANGNPNTFLFSPSFEFQAGAMGQYAADKIRFRKMMIVSDGSEHSRAMADTFRVAMQRAGVEVHTESVRNVYGVDELHNKLKRNRFDGLYMPIFNEQVINYTMTKMFQDSLPLKIIGAYEWQFFEGVDIDLLHHFEVYYPAPFSRQSDTTGYRAFDNLYRTFYRNRTLREASMGYDAIRTLIWAYGTFREPISLSAALHRMRPRKGISQNFYFGEGNINQSVQVMRYTKDSVTLLPKW